MQKEDLKNQKYPDGKWKISTPVHVKILKISDYLPHQCESDGEVCDGHEFPTHCYTYHRGWCPEGSLVNATQFRYWILWFDDANLLEFLDLSRKLQYKKADHPWFHSE